MFYKSDLSCGFFSRAKGVVPSFVLAASIVACLPAKGQDAFDSSWATGVQTEGSSMAHYSGFQTMQGGSSSPPILQGATNGTIGPQGTDATVIQGINTVGGQVTILPNGMILISPSQPQAVVAPPSRRPAPDVFDPYPEADQPYVSGANKGAQNEEEWAEESSEANDDRTFTDGPLTPKQIALREFLIAPVTCKEPLPPTVFPPLPQDPALPAADFDPATVSPESTGAERKARDCFAKGKELTRAGSLQAAALAFAGAIDCSADEVTMRNQIVAFFAREAEHSGKKSQEKKKADFLRMALFFEPANGQYAELLNGLLLQAGVNASDFNARRALAVEFEEQGRLPQAVVEWRAAARLAETPATDARLARALVAAKCDRDAVAELRKTVKVDWPRSMKADLAICHRELGNLFLRYSHQYGTLGAQASSIALLENAVMEARRAVVLTPGDLSSRRLFLQTVTEATAICPAESDNHMLLAAAYLLKGDLHRASVEYGDCKRYSPEDPRLPIARFVYRQVASGRSLSAPTRETTREYIADVELMLDREPKNHHLWDLLGRLHQDNANASLAKDCFARAQSIYWRAEN